MSLSLSIPEVLEATGGKLRAGLREAVCTRVSTDSRQIEEGSLFIALQGERFDGHDFIRQAVARGARTVLATRTGLERLSAEILQGAQAAFVTVPDTLEALGDLARWHRMRHPVRTVAITGTNGKTATREFVAALLSRHGGEVLKTPENHNNRIGVPLTLLGLTGAHTHAVLELGTSEPGEIEVLADMVRPEVGVITNVAAAHTEGLQDADGVALEKGALFEALPHDGTAVINLDDARCVEQSRRTPARRTTFGEAEASEFRIREYRFGTNRPRASGTVVIEGNDLNVDTSLVGFHQVRNAAAALAAASALGVNVHRCAPVLWSVDPAPHRMEYQEYYGVHILDDTYNANPASMRYALETLERCRNLSGARSRTIAVLGDMLELGDLSDVAHARVGRKVAEVGVDLFIAVGEAMKRAADGAREAGVKLVANLSRAEAGAQQIARAARPGDWILVKGSRAMGMEVVVDELLKGVY